MACGLRRCSGRRGCICPKAPVSPYGAISPAVLSLSPVSVSPASVEERDGEAVPEDVVKLFQYFDLDGNGQLDRDELTEVLQRLDRKYWTAYRIGKMFRVADLDRDRFISWPEFLSWVFAVGKEQQAVRASLPKLDAAKSEQEAALATALAKKTVVDLRAGLECAKSSGLFTPDELQKVEKNIATLLAPFEISVSSLSGLTCTVEATREWTVASLCEEVSKRFGTKAYRIQLAHEGGRLEPPSATLEELGVKSNMELGAQFRAVDPSLELECLEFLEALRRFGLVTEKVFNELQRQYHDGKLEEDICRNKYKISLKHHLEAEEKRLRREAEERRKREEEQRTTAERRDATYATHRARIEALTFEELVAQATEAGLVKEAAEVPKGDESEEVRMLIEHLSLTASIEACKAQGTVFASEYSNKRAQADKLARPVQAMKEDYLRDLDEALPAQDEAVKCLRRLKADHIREIKCLRSPPAGVRLTTEAMCIMFQIQPVRKSRMHVDYWEAAQWSLLNDPKKLLDDIFQYDKDNIPDAVIQQIQPYLNREDFDPPVVKKASVACEAFCMWVRAVDIYHRVASLIRPQLQAVREAEAEIQPVMDELLECQTKCSQTQEDILFFERKLEGLGFSKAVSNST